MLELGCGMVVAGNIKEQSLTVLTPNFDIFAMAHTSHPISVPCGSQPKKRLSRLQQPHGCNLKRKLKALTKKTWKFLCCGWQIALLRSIKTGMQAVITSLGVSLG